MGGPLKVVQCGWCPLLLADDYMVWYLHFAEAHGTTGYSIRHVISSDWDLSELTERK
jgi:hypothetical protein